MSSKKLLEKVTPFLDQVFDEQETPGGYGAEPRASGLPFCGREYVLHRLKDFDPDSPRTFFGDFVMATGTTLHSIAQRYFSAAGMIFGNFICEKCSNKFIDMLAPVRCCGQLATYEEYSITHPCGIIAHPDGVIFKLPNGEDFRAILEFKGAHQDKIKKLTSPVWTHATYQANFYLCAMNEMRDFKLDYILVMYISRDLPSKRKYFLVKPNLAVYRNTVLAVKEAKEKLKLKILPQRICNEPSDGHKLYCDYASICFLPDKLLKLETEK